MKIMNWLINLMPVVLMNLLKKQIKMKLRLELMRLQMIYLKLLA